MGLTTTPLPCVSPATAQDVAASAVAGQPTPAGASSIVGTMRNDVVGNRLLNTFDLSPEER
jgi:hypothetical protein